VKGSSQVQRRLVAAWAAIISWSWWVAGALEAHCYAAAGHSRTDRAIKPTATPLPVETGSPTSTPEPTATAVPTAGPALTRVPAPRLRPSWFRAKRLLTRSSNASPNPTVLLPERVFRVWPLAVHLPDAEFGSVFTGAFRALSREDALPTWRQPVRQERI